MHVWRTPRAVRRVVTCMGVACCLEGTSCQWGLPCRLCYSFSQEPACAAKKEQWPSAQGKMVFAGCTGCTDPTTQLEDAGTYGNCIDRKNSPPSYGVPSCSRLDSPTQSHCQPGIVEARLLPWHTLTTHPHACCDLCCPSPDLDMGVCMHACN